MKRFRHGLVLGKFLPLHAGHSQLIDRAIVECEKVTVQLLASSREEIPMEVRQRWLEEVHPSADIVAAYDEIPVDFKDPSIWDAHMEVIEGLLHQPVDVVFTSDDYGHELARRLHIQWVQVDRGRKVVPVSGTAVRDDPYKNWNFLSPPVRAWYTRRVVVLGAESTGSTTLALALAESLGCPYVPEFGREWSEARAGGLAAPWQSEEFEMIAQKQTEMEEQAARSSLNGWLVCDTDAFATILWHERYIGGDSPSARSFAGSLAPNRCYVLTGDDIPWVDDGLRDGEHIRESMQMRFRDMLHLQQIPWVEVRGSRESRLQRALRFALDVFAPPAPLNPSSY